MNKVDNRDRATGKTARLLYASEFNQVPILCVDEHHKRMLMDQAKTLNLHICEPITAKELVAGKFKELITIGKFKGKYSGRELYCDEMDMVFPELIKQVSGLDVTHSSMCIPFSSAKPAFCKGE